SYRPHRATTSDIGARPWSAHPRYAVGVAGAKGQGARARTGVTVGSPVAPGAHTMSHSGAVLVVEDHREVREMVRAILEQEGYPTTGASNGVQALEALHREE